MAKASISTVRKYVVRPGHPMANAQGRILRSRFVASEMLGRPLTRSDVVHHRNGQVDDDRPENLEVLSQGEHTRVHARPGSEAYRPHWRQPQFRGDSVASIQRCPTHPGEIFRFDFREPLRLLQVEAARQMGMPVLRLNRIEAGRISVTRDSARRLERLTGSSAAFWLRLQARFDEWQRIAGRKGRRRPGRA